MTAYELFKRCDEQTKDIIEAYFEIIYDGNLKIIDLNEKTLVKWSKSVSLFLYLCQLYPDSKIGKLFKKFDKDITRHLKINADFDNLHNTFGGTKSLSMEYAEAYFARFAYPSILLRSLVSSIEGKITAEQILYNMLVDPISGMVNNSIIYRHRNNNTFFYSLIDENIISGLEGMIKYKETLKLKKESKFKYGEFLTDRDYINDPAVGRDEEIKKLIISLASPNKSAIITGPAGVGKTALVEGLAYRLQKGNVPDMFKGKKVLAVTSSQLVQGCTLVGEFEERIEKFLKKVAKHPEIILFIDEIHTAIGTGKGVKGGNDLAQILKPYLDRGRIKMIGSTTEYEYEKLIDGDSAFKRRFERIKVKEPKDELLKQILINRIECYEEEMGIKFFFNPQNKNAAIDSIIKVTEEKRRDRNDYAYNPDLAISILEKAFGLAIYEETPNVTIENITQAISGCERVYSYSRESEIKELKRTFNFDEVETKEKAKIITFNPQNKLKK